MLPFLKKNKESGMAGPVEHQVREPDEEKFDSMEVAAHDLMIAIHSKDVKAAAAALRAAFELAESEPHMETSNG